MHTNICILIQNGYKWIHIDTKMDTNGYILIQKWIHQCIDLKVQIGLELPSLYYWWPLPHWALAHASGFLLLIKQISPLSKTLLRDLFMSKLRHFNRLFQLQIKIHCVSVNIRNGRRIYMR